MKREIFMSTFIMALNLFMIGIILSAISGCGELKQQFTGPRGPAGDSDELEYVNFSISASRDYSPSSWTNGLRELNQGCYDLPKEFKVKTGNSGTGWVSVLWFDTRYCYQGNAANNNSIGSTFEYKGIVSAKYECFQKKPVFFTKSFCTLARPSDLVLEINGGGCGSLCQRTKIEGTISGSELR